MTTNKIIDDIKRTYTIGVTTWRALRAKNKVMHIIERD